MTDLHQPAAQGRSSRLDQVLTSLLSTAPELEAAAVVSFDGLPMASALPAGMDEDRVAAMSAALLSLGDRAAQGLGRGDLSQVYVEGEHGTVFLVSADDEAVLVAVAAASAKIGLMLFEVRRAAQAVAAALVADDLDAGIDPYAPLAAAPVAPAVVVPVSASSSAAPAAGGPVMVPAPNGVADAAPAAPVAPAPLDCTPGLPTIENLTPADAFGEQATAEVMSAQGLAPDGLAWPQIPAIEPGWG